MLLSFLLVKSLRLAGITSCDCSEVDAELGTEHRRIFEMARADELNYVLEVWLDKKGSLAGSQSDRSVRFPNRNAGPPGWPQQLSISPGLF
jgi:hypothetical protein